MSKHLGDYDASTVIYDKFATFKPSTGATFTLAGSPALSVYKNSSTTQSTAGVTLTVDFDSVTGLNHYAIDTSADGTFYSVGAFFQIVITSGTVDSVSVVGSVVASFTIRAGGTVTVSGAVTLDAIDSGNLDAGTAQAGSSSTITLRSGASSFNNNYRSCVVAIYGGTGAGQSRVIASYTGSSKVATVDENWITNPDNTSTYRVLVVRAPQQDATGSVKIQSPIKQNQGMAGQSFYMRLAVGGGPAIGLASGVTVERNINNTGWATGTLGGVTEEGKGFYYLASAAAADMNGSDVAVRCSAPGCVDTVFTLKPLP